MTVSDLLLMGVGGDGVGIPVVTTVANPQLQLIENVYGKMMGAFNTNISLNTLSVHAFNVPLSISFGFPVVLVGRGANNATRSGSATYRLGLYSMNANTLSLANSASRSETWGGANTSTVWLSMATSATQNITPGTWYLGLVISSGTNVAGGQTINIWGNELVLNNAGNAIPGGFVDGRMTVSTGAMPASIATSELDITGADAVGQNYIIITA